MTSNQRVLLAGYIAQLAEAKEAGTEKDALLTVANHLVAKESEVARLCPSQAAMEKEGWKPLKEGTLRSRADDTRETDTTTSQPAFRRGGHNDGRNEA